MLARVLVVLALALALAVADQRDACASCTAVINKARGLVDKTEARAAIHELCRRARVEPVRCANLVVLVETATSVDAQQLCARIRACPLPESAEPAEPPTEPAEPPAEPAYLPEEPAEPAFSVEGPNPEDVGHPVDPVNDDSENDFEPDNNEKGLDYDEGEEEDEGGVEEESEDGERDRWPHHKHRNPHAHRPRHSRALRLISISIIAATVISLIVAFLIVARRRSRRLAQADADADKHKTLRVEVLPTAGETPTGDEPHQHAAHAHPSIPQYFSVPVYYFPTSPAPHGAGHPVPPQP